MGLFLGLEWSVWFLLLPEPEGAKFSSQQGKFNNRKEVDPWENTGQGALMRSLGESGLR